MNRSRTFTVGLGICLLLGMLDIAGLSALVGIDTAEAPPLPVVITGGGLGVVTLAGVWLAWRQFPAGLITVIVCRVLSALLAVPAFFLGAPAWARVVVAIALVLTVAGIGLLSPALRRPQLHGARR